MNISEKLHYTKDHEWIKVEGDEALIGITDYAQGELGDIVYLDLPKPGAVIRQGVAFGTIEAVKAAADLYAPISGEVIAFNGNLEDHPELINSDPYGTGWIIRVYLSDKEELEILLSADDYRKLVEEAEGS